MNESLWAPVEAAFGRPTVHTWRYPIGPDEMQMVVSSTRGQTRLHDVTLFIFSPQGKLVLIRKPSYPQGAWRAPGGGVAPGEAFADGALREAREETGLGPRLERYLLRVHVTFTCGAIEQPWTTHVLIARTDDETDPVICDPKEIDGVRWGTLGELCGPVANILRGTGRGLFQYRVALHAEVARLLAPEGSPADSSI